MPQSKRWHVYALCEPSTGKMRYIGKAKDPESRLSHHCSSHRLASLDEWIRELEEAGQKPRMIVLGSYATEAEALKEEQRLIAEFATTCDLLNTQRVGILKAQLQPMFGFGGRIRARRKELRCSLRELARAAGTDPANLSRVERGLSNETGAVTAVRLARALDTTVEYLVTGESS